VARRDGPVSASGRSFLPACPIPTVSQLGGRSLRPLPPEENPSAFTAALLEFIA
jgi:hypothetical protein